MSTQDLFARRRFEGVGFYAVGLILAMLLHGAASYGATRMPPPKKVVRVEMAVTRTEKPPPPPEEKPPAPEPEKPQPKPKVERKVAVKTPPPPNQPPPPPNQEAPPSDKPQKPVPIVTGISLGSTVSSGVGMAVRVGNTLYGDVNKEDFVQPGDVQPYAGPATYEPVKTYEITEEPEVLTEVKAEMPEEAKRAGVQGTVILRVEVRRDGTVRKVRVVKGLGYGLDEAALEAMKKFTFKPARVNGKPVDYTISRFYYVFELVN